MSIPLKWTSACGDNSGYASATRGYLKCLLESEQFDLTLNQVSFEPLHTTHGDIQKQIIPLINKPNIPYKIQVIHLTPENFPSYMEQGKYNIGYTVWETSKIPSDWVIYCNQMNELWVPSEWNKEVFRNSGVTVPIMVLPHCVEMPKLDNSCVKASMGLSESTFVFYSIFQWIARKGPLALLRAYLTEFSPEEDVCLTLKTYRLNTSHEQKELIKRDVKNVKAGLNLDFFPQIRLFGDLFTAEQMISFHLRGDCLVSPHSAEGFGLTLAEGMSYGKPVIGTNYSGPLDFMNESNSFLINCQERPVYNMIFGNYNGHMTWADPDVMHLRKLMRYVFNNREEAMKKAERAKKDISEQLNSKVIGKIMIDRLKEIEKGL